MDVSKYVITSEQILCKYAHLIGDKRDHIWGEYIRRGAVTAIIGETSAGKTTLLHNMCYKLAQGEEFLGVPPLQPIKIFYCDYESYNAVLAEHLVAIGVADQWHFLNKEADSIVPRGTMLISVLDSLLTMTPYDLVIIDPLMDADPIDENDNTQASMQVSRYRDIANKHKCGVLLVHNTGKGTDHMSAKEQAETAMYRAARKHTGRGASSRTDRYDIQLNYVVADETTRILRTAKSRSRNKGDYWTVRFLDSDLGFKVDTYEQNVSHVSPPIENETMRQLTEVLAAHPDESLNAIWRQYIDGVMPISRATFYRHAPLVRSQPVTLSTADESGSTVATPSGATPSTGQPLVESTGLRVTPLGTSHLPESSCTLAPGVDRVEVTSRWRSPHHVHGSYGRFVVTSEVDAEPSL